MVSMLEPSFRFSFAKIAFYTMRVKHKRLLCNIFKRKLLIYNMLQQCFHCRLQVFNALSTGTQLIVLVDQEHRRHILHIIRSRYRRIKFHCRRAHKSKADCRQLFSNSARLHPEKPDRFPIPGRHTCRTSRATYNYV